MLDRDGKLIRHIDERGTSNAGDSSRLLKGLHQDPEIIPGLAANPVDKTLGVLKEASNAGGTILGEAGKQGLGVLNSFMDKSRYSKNGMWIYTASTVGFFVAALASVIDLLKNFHAKGVSTSSKILKALKTALFTAGAAWSKRALSGSEHGLSSNKSLVVAALGGLGLSSLDAFSRDQGKLAKTSEMVSGGSFNKLMKGGLELITQPWKIFTTNYIDERAGAVTGHSSAPQGSLQSR